MDLSAVRLMIIKGFRLWDAMAVKRLMFGIVGMLEISTLEAKPELGVLRHK